MSATALFAINGRFLTQNPTGVQRYAWNVVTAMDAALLRADGSASIIAPFSAVDPGLSAIPLIRAGRLTGHAWEQGVLPMTWRHRLLNLCNTAPVVKADQVVCIHDANVFTTPESYGRAFREFYSRLQPLLVRRATRIATVSNASARQLARYLPIKVEGIAVLPNGHEHALAWDPAQAEIAPALLADLPETGNRRFVLAIGSHARHKNLRLLVEAAPGLAEFGVDVVIAGGGAGIFAPEVLTRAPNVRVAGRVSDHDLAYLMDRALCLAFPSWTEGFGLPIIEAMARGCPVISSDRASMPEICGDAALLASPSDPAAWIRHVRSLAESPDLREDLVGRGRRRVRSFSWAQTAAGYIDLLCHPARALPTRTAAKPTPPHVAVVVATRGRAETVNATVSHLLATQTMRPDPMIVSCVDAGDAGDLADLAGVTIVTGPAGLAAQRNTALALLPPETDIVVFFDDDFVAGENWLAAAAQAFRDEADLVSFTGRVLADGVTTSGIDFEEALRIIDAAAPGDGGWIEPFSPYGCNMAFRVSRIGDIRFDERLVLYSWLEDRDFGAALAKRGGRFVKSAEAIGVHMGVKGGRVSGDRFGYSQIVNPLYMLRKGTMTVPQVAGQLFRNISSNVGRTPWPEPFIDRRGRLRGNLLGLADVLRGRLEPERAASIRPRLEMR